MWRKPRIFWSLSTRAFKNSCSSALSSSLKVGPRLHRRCWKREEWTRQTTWFCLNTLHLQNGLRNVPPSLQSKIKPEEHLSVSSTENFGQVTFWSGKSILMLPILLINFWRFFFLFQELSYLLQEPIAHMRLDQAVMFWFPIPSREACGAANSESSDISKALLLLLIPLFCKHGSWTDQHHQGNWSQITLSFFKNNDW